MRFIGKVSKKRRLSGSDDVHVLGVGRTVRTAMRDVAGVAAAQPLLLQAGVGLRVLAVMMARCDGEQSPSVAKNGCHSVAQTRRMPHAA